MAPKRKITKNSAVIAVVDAITESEVLSSNLRSLLGSVLPSIFNTNKVDRHAFQTEVVAQAGAALGIVGKARADAHSEALSKQKAIVSPAERTAREGAEKEAEAKQQLAQSHVESCDVAKKEADKSAHDAENAAKVAQKEEKAAEKVAQKTAQKKSTLEEALTIAFASLTTGGTKSEKDAAVRQVSALCKEYGVGGTLLQAFQLACKREASSRSQFEATTLTTVKEKLDEALKVVSKQLEEESAVVEQKKAASAAATEKLAAAETAQTTAIATLSAARESLKEAKKAYVQAVAHRQSIWEEMKAACEAQDELAKSVREFEEVIMRAFEEAKEKVAPPVEVEPVEEPPEKKQRTEEEAQVAPTENANTN